MQWIKFLSINKTPYYIYKLHRHDHVVIANQSHNENKIFVVLHGITCVVKTFSNKETIPVVILSKNNIFTNNKRNNGMYYKIIALELTYIITFKKEINHKTIKTETLYITKYYIKTLEKYEGMNQVINERQAKARILQLILLICLEFGKVEKNVITIPFQISQKYISILTGLSKNTVSKVISKLYSKGIIRNDKKTLNINHVLNINWLNIK